MTSAARTTSSVPRLRELTFAVDADVAHRFNRCGVHLTGGNGPTGETPRHDHHPATSPMQPPAVSKAQISLQTNNWARTTNRRLRPFDSSNRRLRPFDSRTRPTLIGSSLRTKRRFKRALDLRRRATAERLIGGAADHSDRISCLGARKLLDLAWRAHSHSSRKIRRSAISCPSGLSWSCRMTSAQTSLGEVRTRRGTRRAPLVERVSEASL
jgi:hypothetical protein